MKSTLPIFCRRVLDFRWSGQMIIDFLLIYNEIICNAQKLLGFRQFYKTRCLSTFHFTKEGRSTFLRDENKYKGILAV